MFNYTLMWPVEHLMWWAEKEVGANRYELFLFTVTLSHNNVAIPLPLCLLFLSGDIDSKSCSLAIPWKPIFLLCFCYGWNSHCNQSLLCLWAFLILIGTLLGTNLHSSFNMFISHAEPSWKWDWLRKFLSRSQSVPWLRMDRIATVQCVSWF